MPKNNTSQGEYQEIPPELRRIFDYHQLWLTTEGKQGQQAILPKYDFRGLNLASIELQGADLKGAKFQKANLAGADLRQSQLRGTDFSEANLTGTDFRDADLEKADLASSRGLCILLLARANLADCQLPEEQQEFSGLGYVRDASSVTGTLFTTMLIACGYAGITVFTISDVALLTNSGTTSLPLLGVGISVASFYIAAPFLLLATYIYFHLNLQRLWEALATLPAIFPDGQRLDQKVYPWLFNWLPASYFLQIKRLKDRRLFFVRLQKCLAVFFAWYFVPLTLILLWFRYLYVREYWVTLWHLGLITAACWFGLRFYYFARITIRQDNDKKPRRVILNAVIKTGSVLLILFFFSDGFIYGVPEGLRQNLPPKQVQDLEFQVGWYSWRWWVPEVLYYRLWRLPIVVNFEEAEVSRKIDRGDGQKGDPATSKVLAEGAALKGRDLRCAKARSAFMAHADLRASNLELAYLRGADLREAKLGEPEDPGLANKLAAKMPQAFLFKADLTNACLFRANLHWAYLEAAILEGADLEQAVLAEANLRYANLHNARLGGAILRAANLQGANLKGVKDLQDRQLKEATAWILAYYDEKDFKNLGLPPDHNEQVKNQKFSNRNVDNLDLQMTDLVRFNFTETSLKKADFFKADLQEANLFRTNLQGANLREANLKKARFQETDLEKANLAKANLFLTDFQGAKGLKEDQLKSGKNWSLALYDVEMIQKLNLPPDHNARVLKKQLSHYDLKGADLKGEFLVKADFKDADLRQADLSWTELREANLQGADLSGADLTGAYLGKAQLQGAKMQGTILEKANLEGADLTGVKDYTRSQLKSASSNRETKWP